MTRAWVPTDTFGTRLLLARRELGLTVKQAAAKCGLHYATWSTWENGRKPADMAAVVEAVSGGLGVSRAWLMWGLAPEDPHPGGTEVTRESDSWAQVRPLVRLSLAPAA